MKYNVGDMITNTTGKIIDVKGKYVKIKILGRTDGRDDQLNDDDDFIIEFTISKEHHQMYVDAINTIVPVTFETSIDDVKKKNIFNATFSMSTNDKV